MNRTLTACLAILVAGLLVAGCQLGVGSGPADSGSISLDLGFSGARTILPPISMDVAEYVVSATGPSSNVIDPVTVTANTTFGDLVPGDWTFTVVGRNAAHDPIGEGSGTAAVVIGETATLHITIAEYTGPGSFLMNLSWEPDIVAYPVWTGSLKDRASVVTPMAFSQDEAACTAQSTNTGLHEGYYAMVVRLYNAPAGMDGTEILSTGAAAIVRVAKGYQTVGNMMLHAVQGWGEVEIELSLAMNDPLVLSPSIPFGDLAIYDEQVKTFTVAADAACTTVFYLRGQQVGIDSYDLNATDLTDGETYRLDALSFSTDGSRAASGTWLVSKSTTSPEMVRVAGLLVNGSSMGIGTDCRYTLRLASDPDTVLNTAVVPKASAYSFEGVAPGTYVLKMEVVGYEGSTWSWWSEGMSGYVTTAPDAACQITVPHTARSYDFAVGF